MTKELLSVDQERFRYNYPNPKLVFKDFADSWMGEKLSGDVRFHAFKHENIGNEEWISVVGPDTDNLLHMLETYELTQTFLSESGNMFSEDEESLLTFTAIVHDMAETVIGDIPAPLKTYEDEEEEMIILSGILDHFLKDKMDEVQRHDLIGDVVDVLTDKESKLGKAFNAIEHLGYLRTALNSWRECRMLEDGEESVELKHGLCSLTHEVVVNDLPVLVNYSKDYPHVKTFLVQNEHSILDILNDVDAKNSYDDQKFEAAKAAWDTFNFSFGV